MNEQIITAFANTLLPKLEKIKQGTDIINKYKNVEGFCLVLMQIVDNNEINPQVRQAALANLKVNIEKRWVIKKVQQGIISEGEKNAIRTYLLPALIRCNKDPKYLPLYKQILKIIVRNDFSIWMPTTNILNSLNDSNNIASVMHAIMAVSMSFQFVDNKDRRTYFDDFINQTSPILLQIVEKYPLPQNIYLAIKCFWKFVNMDISDTVRAIVPAWMVILKGVIDHPNDQFSYVNFNKIQKHTTEFFYFNSKKWATRILYRFFQKHASTIANQQNKKYADSWYNTYARDFISSIVKEIKIPNIVKTKYFQIKIIVSILHNRREYLDQYAHQLLYDSLIPFLKLTPNDEMLSQEDPIQFLRKQQDPWQNFTNTKLAATQAWIGFSQHYLVNKKKMNSKYIMDNMKYVQQKLTKGDLLEKEMAMYLICKLRAILLKIQMISDTLPYLISNYVIPEFKNQVMFLRARAVQMFTQYGYIEFKDKNILQNAVQGIYTCLLHDPHTIVKVKAACAFNCILKHKQAIQMVKPVLNSVLTIYIKLLEKYDMQNLVTSLEGIVTHFAADISPFAVELVLHLTNIFIKYCKTDNQRINDQDYDGQVQMAASGCLQAIRQIIDSPLPEQSIIQIQQSVSDIVSYCFSRDGTDYNDVAMEILNSYIYKCPKLSARMWFFFPTIAYTIIGFPQGAQIYQMQIFHQKQQEMFKNISLSGPNYEFLQLTVPVLRNFIYKGKDIIQQTNDYLGNNFLDLMFSIITKIYQKNDIDQDMETQKCCASALLIYLIECFNNLDNAILKIWKVVQYNFDHVKSRILRVLNNQLFCLTVYRFRHLNFLAEIQTQSNNNASYLITSINSILNFEKKYEDQWEKQRIVLGMSIILASKVVTQKYRDLVPNIFKFLYRQIKQINEIRKQQIDENTDEQSDQISQDQGDDEDDLIDDIFWYEQHDKNYDSPLDQVDQIACFEEILKSIQINGNQYYVYLMQILTNEELNELNNAINQSKNQFFKRNEQTTN